MQNFLTLRFILIFIFIGVASAAISALLFSSQLGVLDWIARFFFSMTPLRFFGITVATLAAAGISYTASRIGTDPIALGLVPVGSGYPRSRAQAAGTKSVRLHDQPAYGFHRSARRWKDGRGTRARRYLS